ncbi:MAG: DNA-binding transcriptional regulator Fis [Gammaproteobacteria bacterium]|nr:DNA-binding transcriptional regulator Fis [Gammaproteobacteria bacterium]MCI0591435.1 DNA-binding transcriptional regulator Fis [Gammaproteobacteria bacterium]
MSTKGAKKKRRVYEKTTKLPERERRKAPLRTCVQNAMELYFDDLDGHSACDIYELVISQVEEPLLRVVLHYSGGNITKAAELLGINRGTLRKKLARYGLN